MKFLLPYRILIILNFILIGLFSASSARAAITYFGSSSNPNDGGSLATTPVTVTPPSGVQRGDLVILVAHVRDTTTTMFIDNASNQIWTSEAQQDGTADRMRIFWCRFNGTWSGDPSVSMGTTNNTLVMHVFRSNLNDSNWDLDVALSSNSYTASASPYTVTIPSLTTNTDGALVLGFWGSADDNTWGSLTANWSTPGEAQYRNTAGNPDSSVTAAYKIQGTAGSTGTFSKNQATLGGDAGVYMSIAFKEIPVVKIYRSIAPGFTGALATDNSHTNNITLSGGVATFSAALSNNIGVGDAVLIDTGGTDQVIDASDTLLFIHGRTDSTHYTLRTQAGLTPADISVNDTYQIYRAYTSFSDAESGTKNTSIPIDFNGGNRDLVANGEEWNIACYANGTTADIYAGPIYVDGWVTDSNNYLKFYTPFSTNEVGVSQRHTGKWDDNKYHLYSTGNIVIGLIDEDIIIEGLQIDQASTTVDQVGISLASLVEYNVSIGNNIIRGNSSSTLKDGVSLGSSNLAGGAILKIHNNIIYNLNNTGGKGISISDAYSSTSYIYNNTIFGVSSGIYQTSNGVAVAKNNIVQNCNDGFYGTFGISSDYNISDMASDAPGANSKNSTTVLFEDKDDEDFHLSRSDIAARESGVILTDDINLPITTDIDGELRSSPWDIGADETVTQIYRSVGPSATSALANDNSHANTVVLSGGVATFSVDLPNNIGVGDAVLIDTGGTDQSIDASDTLLFISRRTDSTHYTLRTHTGTTPSDISINDTYQIYRAYTSLFDAEAGTKNTSIPITFNGGNRDLVTNNEEWNIACYANGIIADSTKVNIYGWTTGVKNFIKIYTPVASDEVGVSQRHNGKFDTSKYNMLLSVEAISEESIYSNGNFIRIDGLQIYVYSTSGFTGTTGILAAGAVDVYISNNIVKGAVVNCASTAPRGILLGDSTGSHFAWNNIVYGFNVTGSENSSGIYAYNRSYIFNNTIYDCKFGIKAFVMDSVHAINNIVQNCTDGYNGFFHSTSDYNISSLSDDAPGANSKNSTTVQFVSSATKDFHLSPSDTAARKSGLNLSENVNLSFNTDIDGQSRGLIGADWDIGADETLTIIYRSVGPEAVGLLDSDNSHTRSITLTGGVAIFSAALPDNIGVGDAILIDTGGTDQAIDASDTLLFINDRTDSTHYSLSTHLGGKPTDISINDTYQIFRAYTSLFDAEAGTKNTSIPITFVGGNRDLVNNNEQWNILAYANGTTADTTAVTIDGWNTGAQNFIKIYTPVSANEVGVSQRHSGKWDEGKYHINTSASNPLYINSRYVRVDGVQINSSSISSSSYNIRAGMNTVTVGAEIYISNCILKKDAHSATYEEVGIAWTGDTNITQGKFNVWNNIIYDFNNDNGDGIQINAGGLIVSIYNNSIINSTDGFHGYLSQNTVSKNNITQNCSNGFNGTFSAFSDYNISDISGDAPNMTFAGGFAEVQFVDEINKDFHLAQSDTSARGAGANLTADVYLQITTDIDGQLRNPTGAGWDIGADEGTVEFTPTVMQSGGDYSTLSSWEAGVQTDLVASTTRVFSHGGITGIIADNATVTGQTSSATATVVHATATQILLENINGTFQSGEVVQVTAGNSVTISNNGNPASAVAKIDGAWTVANTNQVQISGWTTGRDNYIKIYTEPATRHNGKWDEAKFRLALTSGNINSYENNIIIDGLQMYNTLTSSGFYTPGKNGRAENITIKNNIIKSDGGGTSGVWIAQWQWMQDVNVYNNIVYGFNNDIDMDISVYNRINVFNNTIYNAGLYGIYTSRPGAVLKNNIVQNSPTCFGISTGSFLAASSNNVSSDTTAPGNNSKINTTVSFISTTSGAEDFHLASNDKFAKDGGVQTQGLVSLQYDIDGQTRTGAWDIGADETATQIYRSVGPSATSALANDNSHANTVILISGTATFSAALPNNIGVGDAVIIDTGGTDQTIDASDTILFIQKRNSSTSYQLQTNNGSVPGDIAINDTYQIYRAHTSLADAEAGTKNTSIPITFNGGNRDLVTNNEEWDIACYADGTTADTTAVTIDGWNTGAYNFIKVYTPVPASEVGVSQRHSGKWDDNKYMMQGTDQVSLLLINDDYVHIDGLQFFNQNPTSNGRGLVGTNDSIGNKSLINFSNNIFRGHNSLSYWQWLLDVHDSSGTDINLNIWNNLFYDLDFDSTAIYVSAGRANIYNNTIVGGNRSLYAIAGDILVINNIVQDSVSGFEGTFNAASDYNISNLSSDAPGSNSKNSATVLFMDIVNKDFRLSLDDTVAKVAGVNLSNDIHLPFANDIQSKVRPALPDAWSIGACEYLKSQKVKLEGSQIKMDGNVKFE